MKITAVVRGEEWLSSLPFHVLLYQYFNWSPPRFFHLPLILKTAGQGKLSKRDAEEQGFPVFPIKWKNSVGFKEYGFLPEGLINYLALLGWSNDNDKEKYTLEELVSVFDSNRIQKSGARFDIKKATWINHLHIQECSTKKIIEAAEDKTIELSSFFGEEKLIEIISLIKGRLSLLSDLQKETEVFLRPPLNYDTKALEKLNKEEALVVLNFCKLQASESKDSSAIKEGVFGASTKNKIGFGQTMKTLRLALVGSLKGPDLFKIIEIIGADETIKRINNLTKTLKS
jgi:glutamyl-tRNA synthetase